ncbi:MAG: type III-B CRISPR module RAMP protein Cmr4 [Candidatus Lokiarchaeota archaeon]|nr:type III-B CRISPR module RAMP protein Cmr4 [Candidatus Lokiarchaeota archaeon]
MRKIYKRVEPIFFIVKTPLHMGCGSELGLVDQPIQREKHTSFPKIEASSIKGTLRHEFRGIISKYDLEVLFGPEKSDEASDRASSLSISDGRLLLFPVKSAKGVFAWITSPKVLSQFYSDLKLCIPDINLPEESLKSLLLKHNKVPQNTNLFVKDGIILLEEYAFKNVAEDSNLGELTSWISRNLIPNGLEYDYIKEKITRDIILLSDDDFHDFVNLSTEVITRTNIDPETGTVKSGALFTEEYLPVETIMYSLVMASPLFGTNEQNINYDSFEEVKNENGDIQAQKIISHFNVNCPKILQMGGNATTGKGLINIHLLTENEEDDKQ